MEKTPVILDVNVGIDAAMGLGLSLFDPKFDIKLITTVGGSVKLNACTQNTLHLLDVFNKNIPVGKGAEKPLIKHPIDATTDGLEGLGNYVYDSTFTSKNVSGNAVDLMYKTLVKCDKKAVIICYGPLTNVANLLNRYYDAKNYINKIYVLGGSLNEIGNLTPFAEANFFIDPHATQIVLNSGIDITIMPIQIGLNWGFKPIYLQKLEKINNTGKLFAEILSDGTTTSVEALYGATLACFVSNPEIFETKPAHVGVELADKVKIGTTYVDYKGKPNCTVVVDCDFDALEKHFEESLKLCKTQTEQTRPIIIDCDPGVDDAMAIMNALYSTKVRTLLISCVAGNNPIERITNNALHIVELCHRKTPVAAGASVPLYKKANYATHAHGKQGLGAYTYKGPYTKIIKDDSVEAMYKTLLENKDKHTTILALGPMTNIAMLIRKYPECRDYIRKIVFMGGSKESETVPYPEFNINFDPDAARIILDSGIPIVMIPMELGHFAYLDHDDIAVIKKTNNSGKRLAKMFDGYRDNHVGEHGAAVHDSTALYYLTHPNHFKTEKAYIEVKPYGDIHYLHVDYKSEHPNALVAVDMDIDEFKQNFFYHITKMD